MKGNAKVIATLNGLLADELTAINQYMVHSEMCANWGYGELHEAIEKRAITEMKHAEKHIGRIIFLEGLPVVSKLNPLHIGADVLGQLKSDLAAEQGAVKGTTTRSSSRPRSVTTAPASCWRASSRTKRSTWIGWRPSWTRSSRWGSRTTWWSRWGRAKDEPAGASRLFVFVRKQEFNSTHSSRMAASVRMRADSTSRSISTYSSG